MKKMETRKVNRFLKPNWQLKQCELKLDDWVFGINFYGKAMIDLARVQVSMSREQMTKWELFKHLIWRIWHEK